MGIRLVCPDAGLKKEERVQQLFLNIDQWINSDALRQLISIYGGTEIVELSLPDQIDAIHDFAQIHWDYRKKQQALQNKSGEIFERQRLQEDSFITKHEEDVLDIARELGLVDIVVPVRKPNYILPLGGARMTNYYRPCMARKVIDENHWDKDEIKVVALSGTRSLTELDYPCLEKYEKEPSRHKALDESFCIEDKEMQYVYRIRAGRNVYKAAIMTEFDAMNMGIEKAFSISENCSGSYYKNENEYLNSELREYEERYGSCKIYSMVVASSDPEKRRANSMDTFLGFADKFHVTTGDRLLLVTSTIYVPFQSLKFYKLAIECGFDVDCIGVDHSIENSKYSKATHYIQEIKATIDAMYDLKNTYL